MKKRTRWLFLSFFLIGIIGTFSFSYIKGKIDRQMVEQAADLISLEFTKTEIDSMIGNLKSRRKAYEKLRADTILNDVPPAIPFNPLPYGFNMPEQEMPIIFAEATKNKMPKNINDLAFYSVVDLAILIKTKQITSVELTTFFINRLKQHDKTLHCVITLTEERAMERAKWADAELAAGKYHGLLHGIPYGAKDLLAVKGYKTTWGATPYKDQVLGYDAAVIQRLDEAGAVLCAKLTLGALAWGDVWFGEKTRNPWKPSTGSSGSSAGSASAVSAGLLPFALGTETLGSIVSPSTVCGTTGLRPTFGTVSRAGAMALSWTMDKIGPITRSAKDAAVVFNAIRGKLGNDPAVIDAPFNYDANLDIKTLKVGYEKAAFERDYGFKANDAVVLEKLKELGVELVPIELPQYPNITFILEAEAAAAFDVLTRSNQDDLLVRQIKNAWPNVFRQARFIPAVEYINANRKRTQLIQEMDEVMKQVDVYVHPSWGSSSLAITNMTGHPCIVLPSGFKDETPTSISFTGRLFEEGKILRLAQFLQDHTDFEEQHPKGF